jgi:hypothetical protein
MRNAATVFRHFSSFDAPAEGVTFFLSGVYCTPSAHTRKSAVVGSLHHAASAALEELSQTAQVLIFDLHSSQTTTDRPISLHNSVTMQRRRRKRQHLLRRSPTPVSTGFLVILAILRAILTRAAFARWRAATLLRWQSRLSFCRSILLRRCLDVIHCRVLRKVLLLPASRLQKRSPVRDQRRNLVPKFFCVQVFPEHWVRAGLVRAVVGEAAEVKSAEPTQAGRFQRGEW